MHNTLTETACINGKVATDTHTVFDGVGFNQFNGANFEGRVAFQAMRSAFERAMRQFPEKVRESYYIFGGHSVRIRIIGRQLAQHILQPFSHLQTEMTGPNPSQLTIDLWDENTTNIRCYARSRASGPGWTQVTSKSSDGQFIGQLLPNTLTCFDRKSKRIVGSIAWGQGIFIYERAKPLARLLLEWYNDRNIQVIHAGLVSRHDQGVLFVGKSGSGKSTASLASLCAGFNYLGEDYIGLQTLSDGSFIGHSLYSSAFLDAGHLTRFPQLEPYIIKGRPQEKKSVVILSQVLPGRIERSVPIRILVLPYLINASESRIRPASKVDALLALGPSSLIELPSRGMDSFGKLAQLVEQVPAYWLGLGRDQNSIPQCVEEIIAGTLRS